MKHRLSPFLIAGLLLAGCATSSPVPQRSYSLATGSPPPAQPTRQQAARVLRVERVVAAPWLQGQRICYRLRYHSAVAVAYYSDSHWAAPLPAMLGQLVQNALAARGAWKAVIGPGDTAEAAIDIRIRLLDLCQDFPSPQRSTGIFDARVTVIANRGGRVIAQREFRDRRPAPTPDAAGGVAAERAATQAFATAVADWIGDLALPAAR